jgi:hypothetical protein
MLLNSAHELTLKRRSHGCQDSTSLVLALVVVVSLFTVSVCVYVTQHVLFLSRRRRRWEEGASVWNTRGSQHCGSYSRRCVAAALFDFRLRHLRQNRVAATVHMERYLCVNCSVNGPTHRSPFPVWIRPHMGLQIWCEWEYLVDHVLGPH